MEDTWPAGWACARLWVRERKKGSKLIIEMFPQGADILKTEVYV